MKSNQPYATWLEINLAAVERNVRYIIENTGVPYMAVLKGNAYGHGAVDVGKAVLKGGASWLSVARVNEGMALREAGIARPSLCWGCRHSVRWTWRLRTILPCLYPALRLPLFFTARSGTWPPAASPSESGYRHGQAGCAA